MNPSKPICVECQVPYLPEESGVAVEEMAGFGPYKLWSADLLRCPKCKHLIIFGFGEKPIAIHHDPDYDKVRRKWLGIQGRIFQFY